MGNFDENSKGLIDLLASLPSEKRNSEVFSLIDKIVSDNKNYPILGRYTMPPQGPIDDIVLWKHVDWAGHASINVFFIDAGAWEDWKINGYEGK